MDNTAQERAGELVEIIEREACVSVSVNGCEIVAFFTADCEPDKPGQAMEYAKLFSSALRSRLAPAQSQPAVIRQAIVLFERVKAEGMIDLRLEQDINTALTALRSIEQPAKVESGQRDEGILLECATVLRELLGEIEVCDCPKQMGARPASELLSKITARLEGGKV